MSQTVKLKRSAVSGKVPTTVDLELGELAINTFDGKVYFEKDNGVASIVTLATTDDLSTKQDTLVSGTNIKTVNGNSVLGSGNLTISFSQVYPGSGIAVSTGTGWSTSLATPTSDVVGISDSQTLSNKTLTNATLNSGYTEQVYAVSGTTPALSPLNGSIQTWMLAANSTPTAGTWNSGQSITLMVDDGTAYTITWTSLAVTWKTNTGNAPTLNTSGYTAIVLWKVGTVIYGARVGDL